MSRCPREQNSFSAIGLMGFRCKLTRFSSGVRDRTTRAVIRSMSVGLQPCSSTDEAAVSKSIWKLVRSPEPAEYDDSTVSPALLAISSIPNDVGR